MSKKTPDLTIAEMTGEKHNFLAEVNPRNIQFSSTNEQLRDPSEISEEGIKELADSIAQKGLLQPILLRPHGNGNYILVAGERRLRACISLKMDSVPAYVKDMTKEEAFELQITENLQRKDVHPMKEARAYKFLADKHNHSTADLALRFGKSETYVLQRLRLLSLIPEIQKDFAAGDLNLAQALVIARLEKADQEEVVDSCKNQEGLLASKRNYYQSVQELENHILENVTRELKSVPWDLNDPNLVPKAGACVACPKRSGAQGKLFADVKEKDRCFDSVCFKGKLNAMLFIRVKKLVEEKPDTIFLQERDSRWHDKPDQRIASFLSGQKIKPLVDGQGFQDYSWGSFKKSIKGLYINGDHAGHFKQVYVAGPATKAVTASSASTEQKVTPQDIKESIERIKERTKRAAELDDEKVYDQILKLVNEDVSLDDPKQPGTAAEMGLLAVMLYKQLYDEDREKANKLFKLYGNEEKDALKFQAASVNQILWMVRMLAPKKAKYGNSFKWFHDSTEALLIRQIAKNYGINVDELDTKQADERKLREERAEKRIKELQALLKPKKERGGKKK